MTSDIDTIRDALTKSLHKARLICVKRKVYTKYITLHVSDFALFEWRDTVSGAIIALDRLIDDTRTAALEEAALKIEPLAQALSDDIGKTLKWTLEQIRSIKDKEPES